MTDELRQAIRDVIQWMHEASTPHNFKTTKSIGEVLGRLEQVQAKLNGENT